MNITSLLKFGFFLLLISSHVIATTDDDGCIYSLSSCEAYQNADAIFIGKVTNIVPDSISMEQLESDYDQTAYVTVEKVYKGIRRRNIVLRQLGGKRAEKFIYGARYLFYANYDRAAKHWEVRPCGRTRMANYVQDDLRYLDNRSTSVGRTRMAGEVYRYFIDPDIGRDIKRLEGIKIKIIGAGRNYEAVTDSNGIYEVYDLPPGKYRLSPEIPDGLAFYMALHYGPSPRTRTSSLEIELKENGCSGATIMLKDDESIKKNIGNATGDRIKAKIP